ncbi:MAG: thiamine pyrophosphate-dependent dehydrogenase E1 component subunit alpha [Deltaproteobacteria bacterium]|nr:thiamine pyrophosphate-dependent dehydrogenase E1 component subunit alpha [Deltaproteobacteria bacterium]MBW1924184.1 thiamine pyrophosphate-dependent dehydrogenase E1 component subunit alpha [Deltaproteobacteria bacterium]MBW1950217.1 thiamine pyrophosphate-dependent dehydrogenase E1 component subunit alpha [Deltaproteobacteria bacterium]MBW2009475.1 thiamine pyrophosphate-dependent dehydrogenase E1 component subunit alpha [Deltaproteobacteria bacterium]MBW2348052.1 thiamine pyrophosphate-d
MKFEKEDLVKLYRNLVRTRAFDEAAVRWLAQGKLLAFYHPAQGGEAPGVGGCTFLRDDDIVYPHLRGHGLPHMIGKGISPKLYLAEHCGKATGAAGGMGGFHSVFPEKGALGAGGTIGSCFPVSVGWALAAKKNGRGQVVVCFFGDGSANRGTWHEAANMAALWKLPVVWVCENNGVAQFVPIEDAYPLEDLSNLASAFGMPAVVVDGQDVMAVAEAVTAAVERAREGKGPSFVECKTARFGPHGIGNPDKVHGKDRDPRQIEELKRRDPVALFRSRLLEQGVLTEEDAERISREAEAEVAETEAFIDQSPFPDDPGMLDRALYAE